MTRTSTILALTLALLIAIAGGAWYVTRGPSGAGEAVHPQGASSRPEVVRQWICPMHPQVIQDRPGSCPICKMDLVPAEGGGDAADPDADGPQGLVPVRLSATMLRRVGARSEPVERVAFLREVRAAARVEVDETRYRQVHSKVSGWVEQLWADSVGQTVRAGEPLLAIYSPELLAAQQEFRVALRARDTLGRGTSAEVAESGVALLAAARRRLELLDVSAEEIDRLEAGGEARRTVTLLSPVAGTILDRNVAQGARIEPGTEVVKIADLSRVWVVASIYEFELPYVSVGQQATMTLSYLRDREYRGRVTFIYPTLDPMTRTVRVRLEFGNPDLELKPEMFAEVRLVADMGMRLSVPVAAVMDTGERQVAFADLGEGAFEPRTIAVGLRLPDRVEVLSGLSEGERVLAEGNFFIDSESRLKAALQGASAGHAH